MFERGPLDSRTVVDIRRARAGKARPVPQPRPVLQFGQVLALENYSDSWYDALESQFRMRVGRRHSVNVAYALSRSYLDGVDFFLSTRGTQRTPHERGYNPSDQA
jgi:hypothetical protein